MSILVGFPLRAGPQIWQARTVKQAERNAVLHVPLRRSHGATGVSAAGHFWAPASLERGNLIISRSWGGVAGTWQRGPLDYAQAPDMTA